MYDTIYLELSIAVFDVWHLLSCNCLVWWRDAEGVPWETLGIRALPWAPPMFQIPLLLYHPGKIGSILGGIFEIFFCTFCVGCHGPPLGLKHFCGLLPCFRCYQRLPSTKSWHCPFEFVSHAKNKREILVDPHLSAFSKKFMDCRMQGC